MLKRIASHPLANVNSVEFNPETYEPQIVSPGLDARNGVGPRGGGVYEPQKSRVLAWRLGQSWAVRVHLELGLQWCGLGPQRSKCS